MLAEAISFIPCTAEELLLSGSRETGFETIKNRWIVRCYVRSPEGDYFKRVAPASNHTMLKMLMLLKNRFTMVCTRRLVRGVLGWNQFRSKWWIFQLSRRFAHKPQKMGGWKNESYFDSNFSLMARYIIYNVVNSINMLNRFLLMWYGIINVGNNLFIAKHYLIGKLRAPIKCTPSSPTWDMILRVHSHAGGEPIPKCSILLGKQNTSPGTQFPLHIHISKIVKPQSSW